MDDDALVIAGERFASRLILGTAGYPTQRIMADAVEASGCDMVTVSMRRISLAGHGSDTVSLLKGRRFLPNTAGCETARDAILTAELGREALGTDWVKLEIIGDRETLYPDAVELLKATEQLVERGFTVLPYCFGGSGGVSAPGGSRRRRRHAARLPHRLRAWGWPTRPLLELICRRSPVPVVVDAGIGTASDAAIAMELGASAVLLNTAVSKADDLVLMARAFRHAVEAGRLAHRAGRIPARRRAEPSSPQMGLAGS